MDDIIKKLRIEIFKALTRSDSKITITEKGLKFHVESIGTVEVMLEEDEQEYLKLVD